jgi:anti-anti-sigma regulatory factor
MGFESNIAGQTKLDFCSASSAAQRLVVLDLAEVDTIDAAGLGNFILLKTLACVAGMKFKLMNVTERVRELLSARQLDSVFETWLPEEPKSSHLQQESSFATRYSSLEELFEPTA